MTREEAIKRLEIIATNLCGQSAQNPNLWPDYKAVDIAISALRRKDVPDKDVGKNEPLTNAQKIRAMTDDELYDSGIEDDFHECDFVDGECPHGSDIVWWLKQPAEEDDYEQ